MSRPQFAVTACVLLHRDGRWLVTVRAAGVDDAPGLLGLVGGHVEAGAAGTGVLEATAVREVAEEVEVDLGDVALRYLESEAFATDAGHPQVCVVFTAAAPPDVTPYAADPHELTEVRWCTPAEAAADPRCPAWLPALLERADAAVRG